MRSSRPSMVWGFKSADHQWAWDARESDCGHKSILELKNVLTNDRPVNAVQNAISTGNSDITLDYVLINFKAHVEHCHPRKNYFQAIGDRGGRRYRVYSKPRRQTGRFCSGWRHGSPDRTWALAKANFESVTHQCSVLAPDLEYSCIKLSHIIGGLKKTEELTQPLDYM